MGGFKKFILQGDLVALATGFIIGTAFATVVTAFTTVIMDLIGKAGGTPDFSDWTPEGIHVGAFLTALISFLIVAAIVYFFVVLPYTKAKERYFPAPDPGPSDVELLTEIRDLLASQGGTSTGGSHRDG